METGDLAHVTYSVACFSAPLYASNIVSEILSRLRSLLYRARCTVQILRTSATTTSNGRGGKIADVKKFVYIVYRALAVIVNVNPACPCQYSPFPIVRGC